MVADKNFNLITLVTKKKCFYNYITAYSEPWHNQNSLFRHIQGYSYTFKDIQEYSAMIRHIDGH